MFVILINYKKPLAEVDQHVSAHRSYLDKFYLNGTMIASGRRVDQKGGVLLANLASRAEAEQLVASDPYNLQGVADYDIIDFHPAKYAPDFAAFVHLPPRNNELRPDTHVPVGDVDTGAR
jgi:uncharacterized protein YciI